MPPPPPPPYPNGRALLSGRTVLVTAAAGTGIGFATAKRCIEEGATVVISDKHERRLAETAEQLSALAGDPVAAVPCDVTVEADVQRTFAAAIDAGGGRLDVAVNNAGFGVGAPLAEMDDELWHSILDITLTGTMRCTRAALRHMVPNGSGVIVNNASVLGWRAQADWSAYAAAKAGVMALTRCAAMEGAAAGIRVNAVAPSLALHPFLSKSMRSDELRELERREALGRAAEPWEVANVIVFLASEYSTYLTGEVVSVSSQHP